MDGSTALFFLGAAVLVLLMAWRGWRLGLVRQALSIVALGVSYLAGALLGRFLIPVLRPLGFPDRVLTVLGAVLVALAVYAAAMIFVGLVFKRTEHQGTGLLKLIFGLPGALLGAAFGLFLVFVCIVGVRLAGAVAAGEMHPRRGAPPPRPIAAKLAAIKRSIEEGPAGAAIAQADPIPASVYSVLGRLGQLTANPESVERFVSDRDVRRVSANPKILALRDDAEVQRALRDGDYFSLLRNPKLVEAANDPDVARLLGSFDFQKALDRALPPPQKPPTR